MPFTFELQQTWSWPQFLFLSAPEGHKLERQHDTSRRGHLHLQNMHITICQVFTLHQEVSASSMEEIQIRTKAIGTSFWTFPGQYSPTILPQSITSTHQFTGSLKLVTRRNLQQKLWWLSFIHSTHPDRIASLTFWPFVDTLNNNCNTRLQ